MYHEMRQAEEKPHVGHNVFIGLRNAMVVCLPIWVAVGALIWYLT